MNFPAPRAWNARFGADTRPISDSGLARYVLLVRTMRNEPHAIDMLEAPPIVVEDEGLGRVTLLARPPRDGRNALLLAAEEPLRGLLLELAYSSGYDAFACETPLDAIDTLVEIGDRIACAIVSSASRWADGLGEFIADEYPHVERILIES